MGGGGFGNHGGCFMSFLISQINFSQTLFLVGALNSNNFLFGYHRISFVGHFLALWQVAVSRLTELTGSRRSKPWRFRGWVGLRKGVDEMVSSTGIHKLVLYM